MTKIDIFSGFLGAGKTTLIKKLIKEAFAGQQIVLIENEFGEIGIDGGFLKESGIQINELNSGCICCSLVGDFREALKKVVDQYHPDRILIEPSGVGKLSDVTRAVEGVAEQLPVKLNSFVTIADVNKVKMYMKNFGEFYDDQISHASCILLSRTQNASDEKIAAAVAMIQEKNPTATIVTTPWDSLKGAQILTAMEGQDDFVQELRKLAEQANAAHAAEDAEEHHHHHHDDDDDDHDECCHHHHDDDDDDDHDGCCHHHHDDDDHDECCHHHHDDDDDHDHDEHEHGHCCHHHHHHDGHDADEVFTSWGVETAKKFTETELRHAMEELDSGKYGAILRAKGIVNGGDTWYEFDFVPGETDIRKRGADVTGKLVVIGSKLDEKGIAALFNI
jgi:G3E family GTPase